MSEREVIKIKSDNPAHPHGYYIQFRDCMKPGDVEYIEGHVGTRPDNSEPGTCVDSQGLKPIKHRKGGK
ncbi:MAG: hypothetical protein PHW03_05500 [Eubacteriales bacterium]|nr:hypothetical protein [Eubacteriales bacterium]